MLSEEIEAVKSIWRMSIGSTQKSHLPRGARELNESIFQEKQLSEEAVKAISETITEQQKADGNNPTAAGAAARAGSFFERKHRVWEATG